MQFHFTFAVRHILGVVFTGQWTSLIRAQITVGELCPHRQSYRGLGWKEPGPCGPVCPSSVTPPLLSVPSEQLWCQPTARKEADEFLTGPGLQLQAPAVQIPHFWLCTNPSSAAPILFHRSHLALPYAPRDRSGERRTQQDLSGPCRWSTCNHFAAFKASVAFATFDARLGRDLQRREVSVAGKPRRDSPACYVWA